MSGPLFASMLAQAGDLLLITVSADAPNANLWRLVGLQTTGVSGPILGLTTVL